jgi:hypothetical protein
LKLIENYPAHHSSTVIISREKWSFRAFPVSEQISCLKPTESTITKQLTMTLKAVEGKVRHGYAFIVAKN